MIGLPLVIGELQLIETWSLILADVTVRGGSGMKAHSKVMVLEKLLYEYELRDYTLNS